MSDITTPQVCREAIARALDDALGVEWQSAEALSRVADAARAAADALRARGLSCCISCGRPTGEMWQGVGFCSPCQDRNPSIQQLKAML